MPWVNHCQPRRHGVAVVSRCSPDLAAGSCDVGYGAPEEADCKPTQEQAGNELASCGLVVDFQQADSTGGLTILSTLLITYIQEMANGSAAQVSM